MDVERAKVKKLFHSRIAELSILANDCKEITLFKNPETKPLNKYNKYDTLIRYLTAHSTKGHRLKSETDRCRKRGL